MKWLLNALIVHLLTSCSTTNAREWYRCGVEYKEQDWRICETEKDGAAKDLKGFCFIALECKDRFIGKPKKRTVPLYCPFTDVSCIQKFRDSGKKLIFSQY